jgi:glycine/D-amino acid oxidase-like deaminating enzyme
MHNTVIMKFKSLFRTSALSIFVALTLLSCQSNHKIEDVVVIGGGLMGSAVAWQLSQMEENVLLIEKQDSVYTSGSSLGEARASRSLGAKGDIFSYLQKTSVEESKKLIDYLNKASTRPHSMSEIYTTTPVTYLMYESQQVYFNQLIADNDLEPNSYADNKDDALTNFNISLADTMMVIQERLPYSGTMNPNALISKLHVGIREKGNRVRYQSEVTRIRRVNDLYEVQIKDLETGRSDRIFSKKLVSAAGPYTGELLNEISPDYNDLIHPRRVFLAFFELQEAFYDSLNETQKHQINQSFPFGNLNSELVFAMIEKYDEGGRPIFKIGGHYIRTYIDDLDSVWNIPLSSNEKEWSTTQLSDYFSTINIPIGENDLKFKTGYSCVYSLTENETPIVSFGIREDGTADTNFVVIGGMSGIGAKGTLAYGLIGANLLLGRTDSTKIYLKTQEALSINDRQSAH